MMMLKGALLLLCVYAAHSLLIDKLTANRFGKCPANEYYNCGSACFETCQGKPEICTLQLVCGCVCKEGYVRRTNDKNSPCIKKELCSVTDQVSTSCGKNEVYDTCGSYCPPTCANLQYSAEEDTLFCIALCKTGCFCKDGFYRAADGTCVPPEQCCTGPNEVYKQHGSACQKTCQSSDENCTRESVAGCFCESPDYVRKDNSTNSPCIPSNQC